MMALPIRIFRTAISGLALFAAVTASYAQEKTEITITRQPGIVYFPSHVMEKQHLIEKLLFVGAVGLPPRGRHRFLVPGRDDSFDLPVARQPLNLVVFWGIERVEALQDVGSLPDHQPQVGPVDGNVLEHVLRDDLHLVRDVVERLRTVRVEPDDRGE